MLRTRFARGTIGLEPPRVGAPVRSREQLRALTTEQRVQQGTDICSQGRNAYLQNEEEVSVMKKNQSTKLSRSEC